ncbi:MAG: hypothetical protein Q8O15_06275 [Rectinemataceae bacterium]|nr:hypothetical protein [Rectinemataceae bacterium]
MEITLPKGTNIHAGEYQLYLPSKEELLSKLAEWVREAEVKYPEIPDSPKNLHQGIDSLISF